MYIDNQVINVYYVVKCNKDEYVTKMSFQLHTTILAKPITMCAKGDSLLNPYLSNNITN